MYMNLLFYIGFLAVYVQYTLPKIGEYQQDPLYQKLYFFAGGSIPLFC